MTIMPALSSMRGDTSTPAEGFALQLGVKLKNLRLPDWQPPLLLWRARKCLQVSPCINPALKALQTVLATEPHEPVYPGTSWLSPLLVETAIKKRPGDCGRAARTARALVRRVVVAEPLIIPAKAETGTAGHYQLCAMPDLTPHPRAAEHSKCILSGKTDEEYPERNSSLQIKIPGCWAALRRCSPKVPFTHSPGRRLDYHVPLRSTLIPPQHTAVGNTKPRRVTCLS